MHLSRTVSVALGLLAVAVLSPLGTAQSPFATQVVSYAPGSGGGLFDPSKILGGPLGGGSSSGSLDVTSLGFGGAIVLGFEVVIADGPGADLAVFENGFLAAGKCFAETCFVEVSSNGTDFARFPSKYAGPAGPLPPFSLFALGTYSGIAGGAPVLANVQTGTLDPLNPVEAGGEAFDLAELAGHSLVLSGTVDLASIQFVRLRDVRDGIDLDSAGAPIWDGSGASGSADVDAVAAIHHQAELSAHDPIVDLALEADGRIRLVLGDPDGLFDLDFLSLRASFDQVEIPAASLLGPFVLSSVSPTEAVLRTAGPVTGTGLRAILAVSGRDLTGQPSADQIAVQG